ncbi:MAG TPA: hypothetical protein VGD00_06955, partial [Solirubrobacteraceae bacterium]
MRFGVRLSGALLVGLVAASVMGSSASAAPKLLVLETAAGPVAPGAAITFFSSDLQLTSDRGIDFCSKNVL